MTARTTTMHESRLLAGSPGTTLKTSTVGPLAQETTAFAPDRRPSVRLEVDLEDAVSYWHPGQRSNRALPPDWLPGSTTSLVHSAPVGALYGTHGRTILAWAASEPTAELSIRFGVSEERKTFVVDIQPVSALEADLIVRVDRSRRPLTETLRDLTQWLSGHCDGAARTPPPVAREPIYSTWYTFAQEIDDGLVQSEASLAIDLGCGSVFIDDGWQRHARGRGYRGCGDWLPDTKKFADLEQTVRTIHERGASVALWIAPLLLGRASDAFESLAPYAAHWEEDLICHVLDPRYPEVRSHVANTCLRLVRDYHVDLLKIDFLDQAMVYRDLDGRGDTLGIGTAMERMLRDIRDRLSEHGFDHVAFEFRQPYVSPAIARYGEILRANDCPGDSLVNRTTSLDARLASVGQLVHADPMMWGNAAGAAAVAQQLYAGWFAVPQISMRLSDMAQEQAATLHHLLALWRDQSEVTLDGDLEVLGAERGYDLVRATRRDLNRSVIVAYVPLVIDLDRSPTAETVINNATSLSRLVLRSSRPVAGGAIRSLQGDYIAAVDASGPGLIELDVPAYGSATVIVDVAHADEPAHA